MFWRHRISSWMGVRQPASEFALFNCYSVSFLPYTNKLLYRSYTMATFSLPLCPWFGLRYLPIHARSFAARGMPYCWLDIWIWGPICAQFGHYLPRCIEGCFIAYCLPGLWSVYEPVELAIWYACNLGGGGSLRGVFSISYLSTLVPMKSHQGTLPIPLEDFPIFWSIATW